MMELFQGLAQSLQCVKLEGIDSHDSDGVVQTMDTLFHIEKLYSLSLN